MRSYPVGAGTIPSSSLIADCGLVRLIHLDTDETAKPKRPDRSPSVWSLWTPPEATVTLARPPFSRSLWASNDCRGTFRRQTFRRLAGLQSDLRPGRNARGLTWRRAHAYR